MAALAIISLCLLALIEYTTAWNNGLAITPPMGFSTWNYYKYDFNATTFYKIADAFVDRGLKAVGYEYVNVDAGWWYQINNTVIRNSTGYLTYDPYFVEYTLISLI